MLSVTVNLMTETLTARLETEEVAAEVTRALAALGYKISPQATAPTAAGHGPGDHKHDHGHAGDHAHGDEEEPGVPWWRTGKARLVWLLAALVAAAYLGSRMFAAEAYWIFVAATLIAVIPFGRRAISLARAGSPFSIETLMCVAAVGAVFIGAAEEAAIVVLLFALGELLENVAAGRARAGIRALGALMPRMAQVERDGGFVNTPTDQLQAGDVVRVRPGDRIPSDGVVLEGHAAVDESPVTGESVPVSRGPGDPVVAAAIATDAVLRIRVTVPAADNTISRIVRMVEEATASRAPTQRFIERFSEYWTPGAMVVAALIILIPPFAFGGDWAIWIYRGLSVLLIACPCALVISVPAAMASGLSAGARRGLLIKGGAALERLGEARTMAFDKTGTLTAGKPRVTDIVAMPGTDENAVIRLAAAVEVGSAHPLARAILEAAEARGIQPPPASEAAAVAGKAATALVEEQRVSVGSPRYAAEIGEELPDAAAVERLDTLIAQHRLGERIESLGTVSPEHLARLYTGADLFVLASHFEGYGMAYAEAIAHGLPIVGTTGGAIPRTVPASASRLVPPGNIAALAQALRDILTNEQGRRALAAGARAAAAALPTWAQSGAAFAQLLDDLS